MNQIDSGTKPADSSLPLAFKIIPKFSPLRLLKTQRQHSQLAVDLDLWLVDRFILFKQLTSQARQLRFQLAAQVWMSRRCRRGGWRHVDKVIEIECGATGGTWSFRSGLWIHG